MFGKNRIRQDAASYFSVFVPQGMRAEITGPARCDCVLRGDHFIQHRLTSLNPARRLSSLIEKRIVQH
jgi:hypothetical protein